MEQDQPEKETTLKTQEFNIKKNKIKNNNNNNNNNSNSSSTTRSTSKLNAQAPEFVPKSLTQVPVSGYFYPYFQYNAGNVTGSADWIYVVDQDAIPLAANSDLMMPHYPKGVVLTQALQHKLIKQVEYQFSDLSLVANENLVKHINKDPEGFVPISVVASTKKLKCLTSNNYHLLAQALRSSSKLEVSSDGTRVRRKQPLTSKDKEELLSRTVVAENLPDDHSHQNIEKIFGVAGSVKTIRICRPQESNSSRPKGDSAISNKLHALVEYENVESAEKAALNLNDESNWRKGLRVWLPLRRSPKSVLKSRKSEFDGYLNEEGGQTDETSEDNSRPNNSESVADNSAEESATTTVKKGWAKGRGKPRQRNQSQNGRGQMSQPSSSVQCEASGKQQSPKGPRMPDGTKGFNMGRGKPISVPIQSTAPVYAVD